MRVLFLLASASCAFVAAAIVADWHLFGLEDPVLNNDAGAYGYMALCFAALGLVWDDLWAWVAGRYHRT